MGTPFWGSFTASTVTPFIKLLERFNRHHKNADLVASLKANDAELSDLVAHFNQIRFQHNIDVKIFYESQPVGLALVSSTPWPQNPPVHLVLFSVDSFVPPFPSHF